MGLLVFLAALAGGEALYLGCKEGWQAAVDGVGRLWLSTIIFIAWNYSRYNTLVMALEAMNPPVPPEATLKLRCPETP